MFRPHATVRRPARRGAILIIVLALLALFAIVGLSFVFYADSEATNARIFREAQGKNGTEPPPDAFAVDAANGFLSTFLFDVSDTGPNDLMNGARGHSLAATLYGRLPGMAVPFGGVGTFHEFTPAPLNSDRAQWPNYSAIVPTGTGPYTYVMLDPEWTGFRDLATQMNAPPATIPGKAFIPKNAPYTYPDLNNFYLAAISPTTGEVLVPSFHRPWLFNLASSNPDWLRPEGRAKSPRPRPIDQLTPGEITGAGLPYPLQPNLSNYSAGQIATLTNLIAQKIASGDIIGYPQRNPDGGITGDVQNLIGGVGTQKNDSILIDVGLPPKMWNGKLIKPLVAVLASDLDGLLNLNAHGNVRNGGAPMGTSKHTSNAGFGPWEVNLNALLINNPLPEADAAVFARYGAAGVAQGRNGTSMLFYDRSQSRLPAYSQVNFDGGGANPQFLLPSFANSNAFQVSPTFAGNTYFDDNYYDNPAGMPVPPMPDGYNKYSNHPGLYNPNEYGITTTGAPRTFPLADLKRFNIKYAANLDWYQQTNLFNPSGLVNASLIGTYPAGGNYRLDPAHARRMLVTMRSSGFDRPGLIPNFNAVASGGALQLNSGVYPAVPMYPQIPMTPYPGAFPNPGAPGIVSDFGASDFRHQRSSYNAGLGGIDLNRPLTSYYGPNGMPTPGTFPANLTQAWADRHNLARDIFARLIVATGAIAYVDAPSGNVTLPQVNTGVNPMYPVAAYPFLLTTPSSQQLGVAQIEYDALRYLAQLAANIVDFTDNDDVSTPFIWNPPGVASPPAATALPPGLLTQTFNPRVDFQTNFNVGAGDVQNRIVFGVEKPKLVINEAIGEVTNAPTEPTTNAAAPAQPAHVRFWIELLNPTNSPYANAGTGPLGNGAAQVRYELPDGVPTAYNPYKLVVSRFNKVGGGKNVRQYLQDPTNVVGNMPPGTQADIDYDFTHAAGVSPSRIVAPNNGNYGPNLTPAQGCLIVGPTIPAPAAGQGPQPFEFNPPTGAAPFNQMILSNVPAAPAAPNAQNAMEYLMAAVPAAGGGIGQLGGQDFMQHVVLLRRLANPYLPPNDPAITAGSFPYNPGQPLNPYITVDVMDYVPAFDAVNRTPANTTVARTPKAGMPPAGAGYDPQGYRFSVGKIQPYAGEAFSNATYPLPGNGTLPNTSYSYLTSCVLPQFPTGFTQATATVPAFTFGRHNGRQNADSYTSGMNAALPTNVGETILAPFDWLMHFDRPLMNATELLNVQGGKPHEVTQLAVLPPQAVGNPYRKNQGLAPWFGVTAATGQAGYDLANKRTNNGLFRALDVLRVKPWTNGVGSGGRTQGQINLNAVPDPRILQALLDARSGNAFTAADVSNFWAAAFNTPTPTAGVPYRTYNFRNANLADGTPVVVPSPGITVDDASPGDPSIALYDRPFKPYGAGEFSPGGTYGISAGSGLQDTLLRVNPATGAPLAWVPSQTHPYMQAEMVRKMTNNATTTSNSFAVTITVVFHEVRMNGTNALTIAEGGGVLQRPALGKEAYQYAPGDLRQTFFAIVDRSNMVMQPSGVGLQSQPFFTSLDQTPAPAPSAPPMGYLTPPLNSYNLYLTNAIASPLMPPLPYTPAANAFQASIYADGKPIAIGPGTLLVVGSGANQELLSVNYVNQDGSVNVGTPSKIHAAGECAANCILGHPGIPGFTPGMPAFDRFSNSTNSAYNSVVPYTWKKPKN